MKSVSAYILMLFLIINIYFLNVENKKSSIEKSVINYLQSVNWKYDKVISELGDPDSIYNDYNVYFKIGLKIKYSELQVMNNSWSGKREGFIENIVINQKYKYEVLKDINVNSRYDDIIKLLGNPEFKSKTKDLIGYKLKNFYIFFYKYDSRSEVSIYPIFEETSNDKIITMINYLISDSNDLTNLSINLTNYLSSISQNYNYNYFIDMNTKFSERSNSIGIAYYSNGIKVSYNLRDNYNNNYPIIEVYNNFKTKYNLHSEIIKRSDFNIFKYYDDKDFIFEVEKKRIQDLLNLQTDIKSNSIISANKNIAILYNTVLKDESKSGYNIVYLDESLPNYSIELGPYYFDAKWINDRFFISNLNKTNFIIYDTLLRKKVIDYQKTYVNFDESKIYLEDKSYVEFGFENNGDIYLKQ